MVTVLFDLLYQREAYIRLFSNLFWIYQRTNKLVLHMEFDRILAYTSKYIIYWQR